MKGSRVIPSVLYQHIDDASFLWATRDSAVADPHYDLSDISELDINLSSHIRALEHSGEASWALLNDALRGSNGTDQGIAFFAALLSLRDATGARLTETLGFSESRPESVREWISAMAWTDSDYFERWSPTILRSDFDIAAHIVAGGLGVLRVSQAKVFRLVLDTPFLNARARVLKSIGETKQHELIQHLIQNIRSDDECCRFWAAWSAALLGDKNVGETLKSFVDFDTQFGHRAIQLVPRILAPDNSQNWLRGLAQGETSRRYALIGCGVSGDPVYIPTLINQMAVPEYARVAGEAFSMITGVDLAYDDLDMDQPEDFEAGPNEDPEDENVEMDADEDLPWPNPKLIQAWWNNYGREYRPGVRYLCGQPISDTNCRRVLREGYQRQRISAAYELALMNPDEPLFEWRAPGWRQQEWLGLRKPRANRPAST